MKRIIFGSLVGVLALALLAFAGVLQPNEALAPLGFLALGATFYENLKAFIGDCRTQKIVAPAGGVVSGQPFLHGGRLVVAMATKAAAAALVVMTESTDAGYEYDKEAPLVITAGDDLFWDDTAKKVTKTASGNTWCGFAVEDAASAATTVRFHLLPFAPDVTP